MPDELGNPYLTEMTEEERWFMLFEELRVTGMSNERARELASQLASFQPPSVAEEDLRGYETKYWGWASQWAVIGLQASDNDYQDVMARYDNTYDRRTGQPWEGVRGRQQQIYGMADEAQVATAQQRGRERRMAELNREWGKRQAEQPAPYKATASTVEGLREGVSPAASRYFEGELPGYFQQQGMGRKRQEWWKEKTKPLFPWEDVEQLEERQKLPDPWEEFLKKFQKGAKQKFQALTPRERGYYSSELRPRTRHLSR